MVGRLLSQGMSVVVTQVHVRNASLNQRSIGARGQMTMTQEGMIPLSQNRFIDGSKPANLRIIENNILNKFHHVSLFRFFPVIVSSLIILKTGCPTK